MSGLLPAGALAAARRVQTANLGASCAVVTVDADGLETAAGTLPCRVALPSARRGDAYPDDRRDATIVFSWDATVSVGSRIEVGGARYRAIHVPPVRTDLTALRVGVVEAR